MQKLYIFTFNTIYKVTRHLSEDIRNLVLFLCCLMLMWVYFFSGRSVMAGETQIYCSVITAIIILSSINKETERIEWNSFVYYPMVLFGIGIILIGQFHSIGDGYLMYALGLTILFPALYFVWANRGDCEILYKMMALAILLLGIASFVYCFYLADKGVIPIGGDNRVFGIRSNPNTFARLGVIILLSGIYLAWEYIDHRVMAVIFSSGIGIGLSYILLSISRTAFITAVMFFLILLVFAFKASLVKDRDRLVTLVLLIAVSGLILFAGMHLDDINKRVMEKAMQDGAAAPTAMIVEDVRLGIVEVAYAEDDGQADMTDRLNPAGDINTYSSGRIERWVVYIQNFSFLGKPYSELEQYFGTEPILYAHNNIIEYIFRCGYIVGGIYVLFYIAQGITGLKILFSRKNASARDFFVVAVVGMYSVLAMLDVETLAFGGCFPCIYFLSIAPVVTKGRADRG